jgi:hypothetical protein
MTKAAKKLKAYRVGPEGYNPLVFTDLDRMLQEGVHAKRFRFALGAVGTCAKNTKEDTMAGVEKSTQTRRQQNPPGIERWTHEKYESSRKRSKTGS